MRPDFVVAFLIRAVLATVLVLTAVYFVHRERRRARSAVSDLREEWLDPFTEHLLGLTEEQRESGHGSSRYTPG